MDIKKIKEHCEQGTHIYVPDTNLLVHIGESILTNLEDNAIVLCGTVLQELDKLKGGSGEAGYNARRVISFLTGLMDETDGDFNEGIGLPNGGMIFTEMDGINTKYLPKGYSLENMDNRIISTCLYIQEQTGYPAILITNDGSMRINAKCCGLKAQSYRNEIVEGTGYRGWDTIELQNGWHMIDVLRDQGEIKLSTIQTDTSAVIPDELFDNEYIGIKSGTELIPTIYQDGRFLRIKEDLSAYHVRPRNLLQTYAMDAMLASPTEVPAVICSGPAGTGKTLLALAAGLEQVRDPRFRTDGIYNKILIARPNVEAERGFGFLPGDINEKTSLLLAPYYDNLETLIRQDAEEEDNEQVKLQIQDYMDNGIIEVLPLAYIRGRSLSNCFVIIDEAQNASQQMIRDIMTRSSGSRSKVVLMGDLEQIDNPRLDKDTSGLRFAIERLKGSRYVREIAYTEKYSSRSPLCIECLKKLEIR